MSSRPERQPGAGERAASKRAEVERLRLLRAAEIVLARGGWWGFKVSSVLRQANLSTRSFYRHFQSKNDLLLAMFERTVDQTTANLRTQTETPDEPLARVHAYINALIDLTCELGWLGSRSGPTCSAQAGPTGVPLSPQPDSASGAPVSLLALVWRELLRDYPVAMDLCSQRLKAPLLDALTYGATAGHFFNEDPATDCDAIFTLTLQHTLDRAASGHSRRAELREVVLPFVTRALLSATPTTTSLGSRSIEAAS